MKSDVDHKAPTCLTGSIRHKPSHQTRYGVAILVLQCVDRFACRSLELCNPDHALDDAHGLGAAIALVGDRQPSTESAGVTGCPRD